MMIFARLASASPIKVIGFLSVVFFLMLWAYNGNRTRVVTSPKPQIMDDISEEEDLISSKRGFVAVLYSGTARSFSTVFQSHIINLFATSPYTVHLYFHLYKNEWRAGDTKGEDLFHSSYSINSTLDFYDHYTNLDGQRVKFWSMVKGYIFQSAGDPEKLFASQLDALENKPMFLAPIGTPRYQSSILLSMFYTTKGSNSLKRTYERINSMKYIWVFRVRCDMFMRTNTWEDIFNLETYDENKEDHQEALQQYLTWRKELFDKRPSWYRKQKEPKILSHFDNYDADDLEPPSKNQTYLPTFYFEEFVFVARLDPSSALYTPACDENGHVHDQFDFSSSLIMDHFETRTSLKDIKYMLKDEAKHGFTWGGETSLEFKVRQMSIDVQKVQTCWNIVRVKPTGPRSDRNAYLSSSNHEYCYYADYHGRTCCDQSCSYWLSHWDTIHYSINRLLGEKSYFFEPTLNTSDLLKQHTQSLRLLHHELENGRGHKNSRPFNDLEEYYEKLRDFYEVKLRERTSKRAPQTYKMTSVRSSNHYFLHMYGRLLNRIPCFNSDFANGHVEQPQKSLNLINPYYDKYFPFIHETNSQIKISTFRKHQTCVQNNEPF